MCVCVCDISSLRVKGPSEPGRLKDVCVCQWVNKEIFISRMHCANIYIKKNCNACFGILFVSILCTCYSHFSWYCFISLTIFCASIKFIYIYFLLPFSCFLSYFYFFSSAHPYCTSYSASRLPLLVYLHFLPSPFLLLNNFSHI